MKSSYSRQHDVTSQELEVSGQSVVSQWSVSGQSVVRGLLSSGPVSDKLESVESERDRHKMNVSHVPDLPK